MTQATAQFSIYRPSTVSNTPVDGVLLAKQGVRAIRPSDGHKLAQAGLAKCVGIGAPAHSASMMPHPDRGGLVYCVADVYKATPKLVRLVAKSDNPYAAVEKAINRCR